MEANVEIAVFCVTPCSLVQACGRFGGLCYCDDGIQFLPTSVTSVQENNFSLFCESQKYCVKNTQSEWRHIYIQQNNDRCRGQQSTGCTPTGIISCVFPPCSKTLTRPFQIHDYLTMSFSIATSALETALLNYVFDPGYTFSKNLGAISKF